MKTKITKFITEWLLPPKVKGLITRYVLKNQSWFFKGDYSSWEEVVAISTGYSEENILTKVFDTTKKVVDGDVAFERDGVAFEIADYSWPLLSNLLWVASLKDGNLRVLDFGGALGSTFNQNKKFFQGLNVHWHIVEQGNYVSVGNEHFKNDKLDFYLDIFQCVRSNNIDIALFSGVLEFVPDPYEKLLNVINSSIDYVIIDRSAFLKESYDNHNDRFTVQHVSNEIFPATLPYRILSMKKIQKFLDDHGYEILHEFYSIGGEGGSWEFKGLVAGFKKD